MEFGRFNENQTLFIVFLVSVAVKLFYTVIVHGFIVNNNMFVNMKVIANSSSSSLHINGIILQHLIKKPNMYMCNELTHSRRGISLKNYGWYSFS